MADDWQARCDFPSENARFESLVLELADVDDIGIYPAAVVGQYEQRDGFKDGWNAAAMELGKRIDEIVARARERAMSSDLRLLLEAEVGWMRDGQFTLNMNDVWAWGCADAEWVPADKIAEVATLYRRYGWMGLVYWVSKRRGGIRSEFADNNRAIEVVTHEEELLAAVPDNSQRVYRKISYVVGES